MKKLEEIIEKFQLLDDEYRLEMLLDYAEKLPPIPERYKTDRDRSMHRIAECQTPVFIWVSLEKNKIHIDADVASEAPTVKGFVSILTHAFNGASPKDVEKAPSDILNKLGLIHILGMTRLHGLTAVFFRIKKEVEKARLKQKARKKRPDH